MILTCPQCETKFTVPDGAITAEGRKVRCAQCQHTWHQTPVEEKEEAPAAVAESESTEKAPEVAHETVNDDKGDKPNPIEKIKSALIWVKTEITEGVKPFAIGLVSVLVIFGLIQLLSSAPLVVGQGLAFHNVAVERDGETLKVSGEIVNSMNEKRGVPSIEITALYEETEGDSMRVTPEKDVLHAGESMVFVHDIDAKDQYMTDLKIKFVVEEDI